MLKKITDFYKVSQPSAEKLPADKAGKQYKKLRFQAFVAATTAVVPAPMAPVSKAVFDVSISVRFPLNPILWPKSSTRLPNWP